MKVVRQSPQLLALQSAPWVLGWVLLVIIVVTTGIGLRAIGNGNTGLAVMMLSLGPGFCGLYFFLFVRRDDLILDRNRDLVELYHATVLGHDTQQLRLHHLREAIVESRRSRDGDDMHRTALILDNGVCVDTQPVSSVYTAGHGAERAAAAINVWLKSADNAPVLSKGQIG